MIDFVFSPLASESKGYVLREKSYAVAGRGLDFHRETFLEWNLAVSLFWLSRRRALLRTRDDAENAHAKGAVP